MEAAVTVVAPAKVNLYLGVGPLRDDGFHELATVYQALDLTDRLVARPADDLTLTLAPDSLEIEVDDSNLVLRAARALQQRCGVTGGAEFELFKRIPVAGGLAGGSADAAAALVACNALWRLHLSQDELSEVAAELGSDVPFSLHGGTALGGSRGELLTPVLATGHFSWVVATSLGQLSTPSVYRRYDELKSGSKIPAPQVPPGVLTALRGGDVEALGKALYNDLQAAAIASRPELDLLLESGMDYGALGALVSGSGPTCIFLARDRDHAVELSLTLSETGLCAAAHVCGGPVPGARVVSDQQGAAR